MYKKIIALLMSTCILAVPTQIFGATKNHIMYISSAKQDEIIVGEIVIDNTYGDLYPGQYFSLNLEGAEFDFGDDGAPRVYGEGIRFQRSTDSRVYGEVVSSKIQGKSFSISFFSKVKEKEAKLVVDGEDSGLSSGAYVFATTNKSEEGYKGILEYNEVALMNGLIDLNPVTIREPYTAAFRSLLKDTRDNDTLVKLELKNKDFELLQQFGNNPLTFIIDDGNETIHYKLGRDPEVQFDYRTKTITFTKHNKDIFYVGGDNYSVQLINVKLNTTIPKVSDEKIDVNISGLLVEDQTITVARRVSDPLVLDASQEEIQPGKDQKVKFSIQEVIPGTLFSKGYIDLGVRGGAVIQDKDDLTLKIIDGNKTYTQKDFTLLPDPQGDQIRIEGFERATSKTLLRIEGEFAVTAPQRIVEEVYMFISEPGVSEVAKQTVLTATEDMIQPPIPVQPKVRFTVGEGAYKLDSVSYPMDASPYVSIHQRIMVPIRYVAYALGVDVEDLKWDGPSQTITLKGDNPMTINAVTGEMVVGGKNYVLSEIRSMGGRIFVPVGEIGRAFGLEVDWDSESRTATFN